jgi:hypothetical protein
LVTREPKIFSSAAFAGAIARKTRSAPNPRNFLMPLIP